MNQKIKNIEIDNLTIRLKGISPEFVRSSLPEVWSRLEKMILKNESMPAASEKIPSAHFPSINAGKIQTGGIGQDSSLASQIASNIFRSITSAQTRSGEAKK